MIRALHAMFYSSQPAELRSFLRDKLGLNASDVGGGWLILDALNARGGFKVQLDQPHSKY